MIHTDIKWLLRNLYDAILLRFVVSKYIFYFILCFKSKWPLPPRADTPDWWDWLQTSKVCIQFKATVLNFSLWKISKLLLLILLDALVFIYLLCVTKRKNFWTNIVFYTVPLKIVSLGWPGGVRLPTGGSARLGGVDEEISQKGNICDRQKVQLFTYTINYPQQPKTVLQSRTSIWWRWMRIWWIKFGPTGEMSVNY